MAAATMPAKRLPLRAVDPAELRRIHSEGRTYYQYERRPAQGIEKPIEDMTLDELIDTQDMEPLSESRRSFYATGEGVLALGGFRATAEYPEGSIGATLADSGQLQMLEAVEDETDLSIAFDDEEFVANWNDRRYRGTAYTQVDPITAKQIAWEYERAQDGPMTTFRKDGTAIKTSRWMPREEFLKHARRIRELLFPAAGDDAPLEHRVARLTDEQYRTRRDRFARWVNREIRRMTDPIEQLWHGSYEVARNAVIVMDDGQEIPVRVPYEIHHGRPSVDTFREFWHTRLMDTTEFEIGTDGLYDPAVLRGLTDRLPVI